jgi:hypothetical protein
MIGRRRLLQLIGAAPLTAPAAAKLAIEASEAALAGVTTSGFRGNMPPQQPVAAFTGEQTTIRPFDYSAAVRAVMKSAELRAEYESSLYQRFRHVPALDPDLANKRSFSLAAKIAFQRQRNVAAYIEAEQCSESFHTVERRLLEKAASLFLK